MSIQELEQKLADVNAGHAEVVQSIKDQTYAILAAQWNDSMTVEQALANLENSNNYSLDECGWVCQWIRASFLSDIPCSHREYFELYLDYGFTVDWTNDVIMNGIGPDEILVNQDDGDVYQSGKCIIARSDYTDEIECNRLIEAYMERTGYYPGVFECDRYGNIRLINTQVK